MTEWDPQTYLEFADERSRPFFDLLAPVAAVDPAYVVDLGCGPGQFTARLAQRWPTAEIEGVDSSPTMIANAAAHTSDQVRFRVGDLRDFAPAQPVDVLISNATLHWVPGHRELLPHLMRMLAPKGWLAVQVPGNFGAPSHRLLAELAAEDPYAAATAAVDWPSSADPADYLADVMPLSRTVLAWETTYLHVLSGPDPVFRWIAGTGARPVLQALPDDLRTSFEAEYRRRLRAAYPAQSWGTVLPFRRVFLVAQRGRP